MEVSKKHTEKVTVGEPTQATNKLKNGKISVHASVIAIFVFY